MGKYIYLTKWQIFCDLRIGHLCNEASCYLISGGVKINQRWGINHFLNLSVFSMYNILTLFAPLSTALTQHTDTTLQIASLNPFNLSLISINLTPGQI